MSCLLRMGAFLQENSVDKEEAMENSVKPEQVEKEDENDINGFGDQGVGGAQDSKKLRIKVHNTDPPAQENPCIHPSILFNFLVHFHAEKFLCEKNLLTYFSKAISSIIIALFPLPNAFSKLIENIFTSRQSDIASNRFKGIFIFSHSVITSLPNISFMSIFVS